MSFTDQKPRTATQKDIDADWGNSFICDLCLHKFSVGDVWRWVYSTVSSVRNFITCSSCDGDDVQERFGKIHREFLRRYKAYGLDRE